jgi:hypothetical protein
MDEGSWLDFPTDLKVSVHIASNPFFVSYTTSKCVEFGFKPGELIWLVTEHGNQKLDNPCVEIRTNEAISENGIATINVDILH